MLAKVLFYLFAGLSILSAFITITRKNPVISAVWLIVCLMSLAGIYVMLSAYFVAMVQVIVYAGAVLMLFLFVIMMLNLRTGIVGQVRNLGIKLFGLLVLAVLMSQLRYVYKLVEPRREQVLTDGFGQAEALGEIIFSKYIFPFEVMSILLLVAVIGALVLAGKEKAE